MENPTDQKVAGAIDLSTGATVMLDELRIDGTTTIKLRDRIEQRNPDSRRIVVFADHASTTCRTS
jgi:hypothetical protein